MKSIEYLSLKYHQPVFIFFFNINLNFILLKAFPSNDGTILPLSSTQTPGGESGADGNALSFGISLVPQQSNNRYKALSFFIYIYFQHFLKSALYF